MDRIDLYAEREATYQGRAKKYSRQASHLSLLRLIWFLIGAALTILALSQYWALGLGAFLLLTGVFFVLVKRYQQLQGKIRYAQTLARLNRSEQQCLRHRFGFQAEGALYADPSHPYSGDLDLFGAHSLFQYLNRSETESGQDLLAEWLEAPAEPKEIPERQAAIRELRDHLDWRQEWQVLASQIQGDRQIKRSLREWLEDENLILAHSGWRLCLWLVPLGWMVVIAFLIYGFSWSLVLLYLIFPAILLSRQAAAVSRLHERTSRASDQLSDVGKLLAQLEGHEFSSKRLQSLRKSLLAQKTPLSRSFQQLSYYVAQLDVRHNAFAILLNLLMLWDFFWILKLEKWKKREHLRLPQGFRVMAEVEALQSLATTAYNHPDWAFPVFSERKHLVGKGLGHPLLPPEKRVVNDLSMPTEHHLKLITGSNMAGKSTFLRTLGVNLVLAHTGSPVCAQSLTLSAVRVFTSMRTQDKLSDSTSSFFAELKRLRRLIEEVEQGGYAVFYLLDEILKGTNSRDRHRGGEALIRQLIQSPSAGLIATHDLELGKLEAEFPGQIENWRLEVEIEEEKLHFDYLLKRGISQSFNASILMRQMGIRFEENPTDPE